MDLNKIYSSPFRVYLCILAFALLGLYAGFDLPVSLYPNSSKPVVGVTVPYGNLTAEEFLDQYGYRIEMALDAISNNDIEVERIESKFQESRAVFIVHYKWGVDPDDATKESKDAIASISANWPKEIRNNYWVGFWGNSSGFIAISFFSEKRDLNDLYDTLDPVITPHLAKVKDAENPGLWNPGRQEVRIVLNFEAMTSLGIFPVDIERAVGKALSGYKGGSVAVGTKKLSIKMPRDLGSIQKLASLLVKTPNGSLIPLSQVATIDIAPSSNHTKVFKTNGAKSLILFSSPKNGGNVKRMAEEIITIVEKAIKNLPKDIQYRVLVDPSRFIRSSVNNVMHEVLMAAALAVLVLFLFVGSLKNTITAAIEIPLSMVLAFILMKLTGMNINMISLGGLALSAGMNVDASVVVMENIFRHFEGVEGVLNFKERLKLVVNAVREVMSPVITSTVASLVVFIPLAFTSDLTYAVLGDLAKAVVFSHGFSALVALVLVPTIRLHILSRKGGMEKLAKSPIEGTIVRTENIYGSLLDKFIASKKLKWIVLSGVVSLLVVLLLTVLPGLKREIISTPDTDWIILGVHTNGNTLVRQMENTVSEIQNELLDTFGEKIKYTFTQIRSANRGTIMARLHEKGDMNDVWKAMEKHFTNTPLLFFFVIPWNPSELPIPDPPQMRIVVKGGELQDRAWATKGLLNKLKEKDNFPRLWSDPRVSRKENIILRPYLERWPGFVGAGATFDAFDIADLTRVITEGKSIGNLIIKDKYYQMHMKYQRGIVETREDLESLPIKIGNKIVPLKAVTRVDVEMARPQIYRENQRSIFVIQGRRNKGDEFNKDESLKQAALVVEQFKEKGLKDLKLESTPNFYFEDAEKDLTNALKNLGFAIGMSILLIFVILLFQFGSFVHTFIVMTAIPTGILGVLISLFIFKSTLSLNSALGVILLNGIAVANSIILVDFIRKLVDKGFSPRVAVVIAAKKRLRPILITSLTTILGMLPIAFGLGDGGRVLQPLGISVSGGLWVSMLFTLFIVPLLEVLYLERKMKNDISYKKQTSTSKTDFQSSVISESDSGSNEKDSPSTKRRQ